MVRTPAWTVVAMTSSALLTTSFDAASTAREVLAGVDLTGRRAVVTGGASGIGTETVRALAAANAERLWEVSLDLTGLR
jgi:NADPH:quinone reductase-like Zn-dependent oxidoreductase